MLKNTSRNCESDSIISVLTARKSKSAVLRRMTPTNFLLLLNHTFHVSISTSADIYQANETSEWVYYPSDNSAMNLYGMLFSSL